MQLRHAPFTLGAPLSTAAARNTPLERVLVVDDSQDIRELIALVLRCDGFEVFTAENGDDAKDIIDIRHPTLVISDLEMPVCDGWELLAYCHRNYPGLPVLIMSGSTPGLRPEIENWAAGFLAKPFALKKFRGEVERLFKCAA